MMYAEEQSISTIKSVRRRFVNAVLVNAENNPQTIEAIITTLQNEFDIVFLEKDLHDILDDDRYYVVILGDIQEKNKYYLPKNRYDKLKEKSEYCIDDAISEFILNEESVDTEGLRELLYRYLYSLLNTNIKAYSQLLEKRGNNVSPAIDTSSFEDSEIELINRFVQWDNPQKDKALFELVNYCIDYASAINSIDPNDVVSALKNKKLYLDNTMIYRALGINGQYRKDRAFNLLQRCVSSGQELYISSITREEFFNTIDYHISRLRESTPYGKINPNLFNRYTGGYTIYQYYHEWRKNRITYGFDMFRIYIQHEYNLLLKKFNITEDFNHNFSDEEDTKIEHYADEIKAYKRPKKDTLLVNDAKNMVWIERVRNGCDNNVRDTKFYFVTSDRRLQEWDLAHSANQPITMLPSQWLALLLKYFSQSNNDYKSFVSFLSIPAEKATVSPEELQDVLAGISEITEDFQKQEDVVSSLFEMNESERFNNREDIKTYAKSKIEEDYLQKLQSIEDENKKRLDEKETESRQALKRREEELLQKFQKEINKEKIEHINDQIKNCNKQLEDKRFIYNQIIAKCDFRKKALICFFIAILILYPASMAVLTFFVYDWNKMEPITWLIGIVIAVSILICSMIMNQNIEFWKIPSEYYDKTFNNLCSKNNFEKSEISDLEETISILNQEKEELEKE